MAKYKQLQEARDQAKREWFEFLDKCWFGTPAEKQENIGNADRYRELRDAFVAAEDAFGIGQPADSHSR